MSNKNNDKVIRIVNDGMNRITRVILPDGKELPYVTEIKFKQQGQDPPMAEITIAVPAVEVEIPENCVNIYKMEFDEK